MCGISGFFLHHPHEDSADQSHVELLQEMLALIQYRGPDETGLYVDDFAGLGNVRLKIIDLKSGQQPISDPTGRYWLVYNGEIYNYLELRKELESLNYKFETTSDTEVLLFSWIAWGPDCLARLNGGFAFALYDSIEKTIVLARDRFGKRPLYYAQTPKRLLFASEMKCFLADPEFRFEWDRDTLATLCYTWTVLPHQAPFKDIQQVPPGSYVLITKDQILTRAYQNLDLRPPVYQGSFDEAVMRTREIVEDAIRIRLRSDVEVGTFLSGGLDSSIVTAVSGRLLNKKIKTFSIAFEDEEFDERDDQIELSMAFGTDHHNVVIKNTDIRDHFEEALWHAEIPVFRSAFVPIYLLSRTTRQNGVKVVLTGEGADESFLGYDIFKETYLRWNWFRFKSDEDRNALFDRLYPYLKLFDKNKIALRNYFERLSKDFDSPTFSHEPRLANSSFSLRLFALDKDYGSEQLLSFLRALDADFSKLDFLQKSQWLEYKTLLCGYLLSIQGDRMTLGQGVEARCPFMDYRVIDWSASLPREYKLTNSFNEKHILKKAFEKELPSRVLSKPKQPYRAPNAKAFTSCLADKSSWAAQYIDRILDLPIINREFTTAFVEKLMTSNPDKLSAREDQAFMILLSFAVLDKLFIRRDYSKFKTSRLNQLRSIDKRRAAIEH